MTVTIDAHVWAEEQFAQCDLKDKTTYSTAGPDGGQYALPSLGESARAVYRCGRFAGRPTACSTAKT